MRTWTVYFLGRGAYVVDVAESIPPTVERNGRTFRIAALDIVQHIAFYLCVEA